MSGSSKPKRKRSVSVPHPDDVEAIREGMEQAERGDLLSAEESAEYLRRLADKESPRE